MAIRRKNGPGKGNHKYKASKAGKASRILGSSVTGVESGRLVRDEVSVATGNHIVQSPRGHCRNIGFYFLEGECLYLTPF